MEFASLRKKYKKFIYQDFVWRREKDAFDISFFFKIEPDIFFSPRVKIFDLNLLRFSTLPREVLDNLVFHLGLMEIPSYWKATCSPLIVVECGKLEQEQIGWWKDLILKGMGEFFFKNNIDFTKRDFLQIESFGSSFPPLREKLSEKKILLPIGGGKDSAVVLQLLKSVGRIGCFSLNPTQSSLKVMEIGGCKNPIVVERKIDKNLLELNKKGYLNGHTPFSAYLAFLSVLCAVLFDFGQVAFGNERSADEENLSFLGREINHQYSKSFVFEKKFNFYLRNYLVSHLKFYSFLRPLFELQIGKIFARYPQYFPYFKSCNKKQREDTWCCKCPKCLSVFLTLYPFLKEEILVKIFGQNLLEKENLWPTLLSLIGEKKPKPFECVGTFGEMKAALYLSLEKALKLKKPLPMLLERFKEEILPKYSDWEKLSAEILNSWGENNLPSSLEKFLKKFYFQ